MINFTHLLWIYRFMATNLLSFPERLNDLKSINEFLNWAEISVSVYYCIITKERKVHCYSENGLNAVVVLQSKRHFILSCVESKFFLLSELVSWIQGRLIKVDLEYFGLYWNISVGWKKPKIAYPFVFISI